MGLQVRLPCHSLYHTFVLGHVHILPRNVTLSPTFICTVSPMQSLAKMRRDSVRNSALNHVLWSDLDHSRQLSFVHIQSIRERHATSHMASRDLGPLKREKSSEICQSPSPREPCPSPQEDLIMLTYRAGDAESDKHYGSNPTECVNLLHSPAQVEGHRPVIRPPTSTARAYRSVMLWCVNFVVHHCTSKDARIIALVGKVLRHSRDPPARPDRGRTQDI